MNVSSKPFRPGHPESERRTERRLLCSNLVQVSWSAVNGQRHQEVGVLEDLSKNGFGLSLHTDSRLACGTGISIVANGKQFTGSVTHCRLREGGYHVGFQLDEDCEGFADPEHLLDVAALDLSPK